MIDLPQDIPLLPGETACCYCVDGGYPHLYVIRSDSKPGDFGHPSINIRLQQQNIIGGQWIDIKDFASCLPDFADFLFGNY